MLTLEAAEFLTRTILSNPYIPHEPTVKQARFLLALDNELLYGGAAGGGKSDALLMAGLQFAEVPGYSAIIFRKNYQDLALPDALMDRARSWLQPTDARWNPSVHEWTFKSGARLTFGYLQSPKDRFRYQSAAFQFVAFDELTQFEENSYTYLFSRLRRLEGASVPLRMRAASNPGGVGHAWVRARFIDTGKFIPATLEDNPYLDRESYMDSLSKLDPVTREQYLHGNWLINDAGNMFKFSWFTIVDEAPADAREVRYWDLASTADNGRNDPDWTSGVKLCTKDGRYWVKDVVHMRGTPLEVEDTIHLKAELDGHSCRIRMEQEPGSSGVNTIDHYRRQVLAGYDFGADKVTGPKIERARPLSSASEAGNVMLVRGAWNTPFLDELCSFPVGAHDDQVDATSGALMAVTTLTPVFWNI